MTEKYTGPDRRKIESCPFTCDKPEVAANNAVKKVFGVMGVNIDEPHEVKQFQTDLRFGGTMHKLADRSMIVIVSVISAAVAGALIIGALEKIKCYVMPGKGGG